MPDLVPDFLGTDVGFFIVKLLEMVGVVLYLVEVTIVLNEMVYISIIYMHVQLYHAKKAAYFLSLQDSYKTVKNILSIHLLVRECFSYVERK